MLQGPADRQAIAQRSAGRLGRQRGGDRQAAGAAGKTGRQRIVHQRLGDRVAIGQAIAAAVVPINHFRDRVVSPDAGAQPIAQRVADQGEQVRRHQPGPDHLRCRLEQDLRVRRLAELTVAEPFRGQLVEPLLPLRRQLQCIALGDRRGPTRGRLHGASDRVSQCRCRVGESVQNRVPASRRSGSSARQ